MSARTCGIPECDRRAETRGWCGMHYRRYQRHGDPHGRSARPRYVDSEESFAARVAWDGEHLIWTGSGAGGYGRLFVGGRKVQAHRYAWERSNGPIPEGMVIDHRCWIKACVHLDHLRLATRVENGGHRDGANRNNTTGARGVSRHRTGGYSAEVQHGGHSLHLGIFPTVEEASAAAQAKRAELFGEFAGRA